MNVTRDRDAVLAAWVGDGPLTLPHETREAITTGIRTVPQRRRSGISWPLGRARLGRPTIDVRRLSLALVVVVAVVAGAVVLSNLRPALNAPGGPPATADPRSSFEGPWVSTPDADGAWRTLTVRASADGGVAIVVHDDFAAFCPGTQSTLTGFGRLEGSTSLVIPAPHYFCDDGSEPQPQGGRPVDEQGRDLRFVRDAQAQTLTDNHGGVWRRQGEAVDGWPDTGDNPAGVYSWDGSSCGGPSCNIGFMHNVRESGHLEIRIDVVPAGLTIDDGATAVTVAGHDGTYRRIDAQREEWTVDIEGTTIAIHLEARPGTSQADLAEAHAIVESMRYERQRNDLGFRLVFRLTTSDWDSG